MKFIFCKFLPLDQVGAYAHFKHIDFNDPNYTYLNVKQFSQNHQNQILADIESWHVSVTELAVKKIKDWWLTSNSRLLSWSPAVYDSIVFSVSLLKVLESHPLVKVCYVVDAPVEVQIYLQELQNEPTNIKFPATRFLYLRFLLRFLKSLLVFIKKFRLTQYTSAPGTEAEFMFFSQILNKPDLIQGKDHFYGNILWSLSREEKSRICYVLHTGNASANDLIEISNLYKKNGISIVFTSDFFNLKNLFSTIARSFRHLYEVYQFNRKIELNLNILGFCSKKFNHEFKEKIVLSSQNIFTELETFYSLKSLEKLTMFKAAIFPYEEKSIEKSLLLAFKKISTLGFVHAVMHKGHACFKVNKNQTTGQPKPNFILLTGSSSQSWFEGLGHPKSKLKILGSPRYKATAYDKLSEPSRILFIISQPHELNMFASMIGSNSNILKGFELTVRMYPYAGVEEQNEGFARLLKIYPNAKQEGGNLSEQLKQHDLVFFSTSSGGIEAILHGLIGIYLNLDKLFVLNPLEVLGQQKEIPVINSADQLQMSLNTIRNLSADELKAFHQRQLILVEKIYSQPNINIIIQPN